MLQEINETVARKVLEIVDSGLVRGVGEPKPGAMCVEAAVCYALDLPHGDDPQCVSRALRSLKIRLNDSNWSSDQARAKGLRRLAVVQLGSRDALDDREFVQRVTKFVITHSVPIALRAAASVHKEPIHAVALRDAANRCEKEGTQQSTLYARDAARMAADATAAAAAAYYATDAAAAYYATDAAAAAAAYYAAEAADAAYDATATATVTTTTATATAKAAAAAAYAAIAAIATAAAAKTCDKVLSNFAEGVVQILIEMKAPGCKWLVLTEG